eukprot:COSAG01_NODE_21733_length_887_cov_2.214467_2_plen_128_part_00
MRTGPALAGSLSASSLRLEKARTLYILDSLSRSLVSHPRIYSCTGTVVRHSSLWTDTMLMLYLVLVATLKYSRVAEPRRRQRVHPRFKVVLGLGTKIRVQQIEPVLTCHFRPYESLYYYRVRFMIAL